MFGLEKHFGFVKSLVTEKAGQFSEMITKNMPLAGDVVRMAAGRGAESVENAVREVPDMILPEDMGNVGEQLMGEVGEIIPESARSMVPGQIGERISRAMPSIESMPQRIEEFTQGGRHTDLVPTREIMKKKLNHFQIEQMAERIKERLESEIKVEKERRGMEP